MTNMNEGFFRLWSGSWPVSVSNGQDSEDQIDFTHGPEDLLSKEGQLLRFKNEEICIIGRV